MFTHEMGVDFTGSGTTDGGLTFGGKVGFDTGAEKTNTGTVFVSGSFGTITFGDNDAADVLAGGIADVVLNGVGVDNVVEDIRGTTDHQFRYDQSFGNIALAISAGTGDGKPGTANSWASPVDSQDTGFKEGEFETKKNSYAIGMSFRASGATVGFGYDSRKTMSAGIGYSTGQISANAFYAKADKSYKELGFNRAAGGTGASADEVLDAGYTGIGMDMSYTMGASTLTLVYAKTDVSDIQPYWNQDDGTRTLSSGSLKGLGVGFSHDLGGGAKLIAGFAKVPMIAVGDLGMTEIGQVNARAHRTDLSADRNMASIGLSFSF